MLIVPAFDEIKLGNPGVLKTKLPTSVFQKVKTDVVNCFKKAVPHQLSLSGNIENEFVYTPSSDFVEIINKMFVSYTNQFDMPSHRRFAISSIWANFQKKNEHNPLHTHNSVVSFILWAQIPYLLDDELKLANSAKSNFPTNSIFQFIYNQYDGSQKVFSLAIDKSWEGMMIMFPGSLQHVVYPFHTSDDYRVSIAGNIDYIN